MWLRRFLLNREATDSYTIAASPNFGLIRRSSTFRHSFYDVSARTSLDDVTKTSLLGEYEKNYKKEELDRVSRSSWWSEKASLHEDFAGELPIGHGCSLTQTIFNGTDTVVD